MRLGDIVRLNSGSPPLMVVDIDRGNITVAWMDAEGVAREMTSPQACFTPDQEWSAA